MRKIVVFGATSAIAQEALRSFARDGDALLLVGRSEERLRSVASDLIVQGASEVVCHACEIANRDTHGELLSATTDKMPGYDTVLFFYGSLGDQVECEKSFENTLREFEVNFLSVVSLLTPIANIFEESMAGTIAVVGSVAGDRGRKSNYIYGTSKGALELFLQGLRNRLHPAGVHVLTIKPGFVDTPMTAHLKKGPLFASAESVGKGVYNAVIKRKNVVYLPWFWQVIMTIVRMIPEALFKRFSL